MADGNEKLVVAMPVGIPGYTPTDESKKHTCAHCGKEVWVTPLLQELIGYGAACWCAICIMKEHATGDHDLKDKTIVASMEDDDNWKDQEKRMLLVSSGQHDQHMAWATENLPIICMAASKLGDSEAEEVVRRAIKVFVQELLLRRKETDGGTEFLGYTYEEVNLVLKFMLR